MATATANLALRPTEEIRHELELRLGDISDMEKSLHQERGRIERAIAALTPPPVKRGPGRPRKVA